MRILSGLLCSALMVLSSAPARAEFPVALRVTGGVGLGGGYHNGLSAGPFAGLAAADLLWRDRPGHAYVLSYEMAGMSRADRELCDVPQPAHLRTVYHQAVLIGIERSRPNAGISPYLQRSLGLARVTAELGTNRPSGRGLALSACAGLRITPPPGPVGFLLGLRTSHITSGETRAHVLAATCGLTVHPR